MGLEQLRLHAVNSIMGLGEGLQRICPAKPEQPSPSDPRSHPPPTTRPSPAVPASLSACVFHCTSLAPVHHRWPHAHSDAHACVNMCTKPNTYKRACLNTHTHILPASLPLRQFPLLQILQCSQTQNSVVFGDVLIIDECRSD